MGEKNLKLLLATAADVTQGRGDSTHVLEIYRCLQETVDVTLLHRGEIGIVAGRMESGTEARSVRNLFKMVTYHALVAARILAIAENDTVVYCRDWSVALVAGLLKGVRGFRVIYEANSLVSLEMSLTVGRNLSGPFAVLQEIAFVISDAIVAVTARLAESIKASLDGRSPRIVVIPNAGDANFEPLPKKEARMRLGLREGSQIVGFVGNLGPWQGLNLLVRAFAILRTLLPNAELIIVGEGPEYSKLESLVNQFGLEREVRLVGNVPHSTALEYVCAFDVGTIPYERSELYEAVGRSPIKAYEYMTCSCPIVAGSYPDLSEEIIQARCGIVVPPDDAPALAKAIAGLPVTARAKFSIGIPLRNWVTAARQCPGSA